MDLQLRDKTALVTGASQGIGRAIAKMLTGSRQTIYFVELDGPQHRSYIVQILGE